MESNPVTGEIFSPVERFCGCTRELYHRDRRGRIVLRLARLAEAVYELLQPRVVAGPDRCRIRRVWVRRWQRRIRASERPCRKVGRHEDCRQPKGREICNFGPCGHRSRRSRNVLWHLAEAVYELLQLGVDVGPHRRRIRGARVAVRGIRSAIQDVSIQNIETRHGISPFSLQLSRGGYSQSTRKGRFRPTGPWLRSTRLPDWATERAESPVVPRRPPL